MFVKVIRPKYCNSIFFYISHRKCVSKRLCIKRLYCIFLETSKMFVQQCKHDISSTNARKNNIMKRGIQYRDCDGQRPRSHL